MKPPSCFTSSSREEISLVLSGAPLFDGSAKSAQKTLIATSIDKQAHIRNDSAADAQKEPQTDRVSISRQTTYLMKSFIIVASYQY
jgi:hypothetical protein